MYRLRRLAVLNNRDVITRRLNLRSVEPTTWALIRGFVLGAGAAIVVIAGTLTIAASLRDSPPTLITVDSATVPVAEPATGAATPPQAAPGSTSPEQTKPDGTGTVPSLATHVIQPGETLLSIAARYGTTASVIAALNEIKNPIRIRIGQQLRVPAPR